MCFSLPTTHLLDITKVCLDHYGPLMLKASQSFKQTFEETLGRTGEWERRRMIREQKFLGSISVPCFRPSCSGNLLRFQPDSITNATFPWQSFPFKFKNISVARFQEQREGERTGEGQVWEKKKWATARNRFYSSPIFYLFQNIDWRCSTIFQCLCLNLSSFLIFLSPSLFLIKLLSSRKKEPMEVKVKRERSCSWWFLQA